MISNTTRFNDSIPEEKEITSPTSKTQKKSGKGNPSLSQRIDGIEKEICYLSIE